MAQAFVKTIDREWLGLRDIARYAAVSERTLRSWIHSPVNPLPAVRVVGKLLVRRTDLDLWLQAHRVQPLAELDVDAIVRDALKGSPRGRKG
jgi:excisionase family DNA binding protein